jgi:hypothetical protein
MVRVDRDVDRARVGVAEQVRPASAVRYTPRIVFAAYARPSAATNATFASRGSTAIAPIC